MNLKASIAKSGKKMAGRVASAKTGTSTGAAATSRMRSAQNYIMKNKGKSAMIGGAGVAGIGAMQNRRGRGVSKTIGRPTGIRNY